MAAGAAEIGREAAIAALKAARWATAARGVYLAGRGYQAGQTVLAVHNAGAALAAGNYWDALAAVVDLVGPGRMGGPRGWSTPEFGQQMHGQAFKDALTRHTGTREFEWEWHLRPGDTGVDAVWNRPTPAPMGITAPCANPRLRLKAD